MGTFRGWMVREADGTRTARLEKCDLAMLAEQEIPADTALMQVEYSSLNYKDALALEGRPGVIRRYPLVAGIDAVGVLDSGRRVVLTGAGLGEQWHGGLAEVTRVPTDDCVELPRDLAATSAAAAGTAGFTAALCVLALQRNGIEPGTGPVAVTGASGGVGSIAIMLLSTLGYEVHAVTGRPDESGEQWRRLGAAAVVAREELTGVTRPLVRERFAGAVDTAGGATLAGLLASVQHSGAVAACGLADSAQLETSVVPFILRGVSLAGVDSVRVPRERREAAWQLIVDTLDTDVLGTITQSVDLADVRSVTGAMLAGTGLGRTVVNVAGARRR